MIADVFTDTPLQGNGVAVFTDAREIPDDRLQPIAREMNLSETVFVYKPEAARDAAKLEAARHGLLEALPRWEERLAGRQAVFGDTLTLADVVLYTPLVGVRTFGVEIPAAHTQLRAWFERVSAAPGAKLLAPR